VQRRSSPLALNGRRLGDISICVVVTWQRKRKSPDIPNIIHMLMLIS